MASDQQRAVMKAARELDHVTASLSTAVLEIIAEGGGANRPGVIEQIRVAKLAVLRARAVLVAIAEEL